MCWGFGYMAQDMTLARQLDVCVRHWNIYIYIWKSNILNIGRNIYIEIWRYVVGKGGIQEIWSGQLILQKYLQCFVPTFFAKFLDYLILRELVGEIFGMPFYWK